MLLWNIKCGIYYLFPLVNESKTKSSHWKLVVSQRTTSCFFSRHSLCVRKEFYSSCAWLTHFLSDFKPTAWKLLGPCCSPTLHPPPHWNLLQQGHQVFLAGESPKHPNTGSFHPSVCLCVRLRLRPAALQNNTSPRSETFFMFRENKLFRSSRCLRHVSGLGLTFGLFFLVSTCSFILVNPENED